MKKTALALIIASVTGAYSVQANTSDNYIFNYASTQGLFKPLDLTEKFNAHNALDLDRGTLSFRIRTGQSFGSFLGAADPNYSTKYLSFYSLRKNGKDTIGIEIRDVSNLISNDLIKVEIDAKPTEFRNITYVFDKENNNINIYVDGQKLKTHTVSKFFADIASLENATLGETRRSTQGGYNTMRFSGDVFYADFEKAILNDDDVREKHQALTNLQNYSLSKREALGAYKSNGESLFVSGQKEARNYRIPSLFTTKNGVVIAAIDKRNQHSADWGNIDTAIRRSFDGGKTWQDDQVILDLASQPYGSQNAAFLIDPLMVQDKKSGRIFMIVDMFPEMQGLFNFPNHGEGTGYKNIGGKQYRLLTDSANNHYTVRENGIVYNEESNKPTDYRVVVEGMQSRAYQDLGDLYQGDQRLGNIFLNTNQNNNGSAPLTAKRTSYLWMTHSDDDGATWSNPVDLTPQVKADWMQFMGTGPGNGIQLKNGNLLMPVYYTNNVGGLNSQSPAVIISTDGGQTWTRGESPIDRWEYNNDGTRELNTSNKQMTESQIIELDNGDIKMFSRNLKSNKVVISTSKNGGYTWQNTAYIDDILLEPYSQLSVIKYSKRINGKEIVIFANPHSATRDRVNGKVWLGEVQEDGSIEWRYNTTITTGSYAYNSLTELPNGDIGLLYEESASNIKYVSLNLQELVWHDNYIYRDIRTSSADNKPIELNSPFEETFYKIGDGEMVKIGKGSNPANLIVKEGTATLNQQADENGSKQAYNTVIVEENAKLRLGSADQVNLSNIYLNRATLDLNGNTLEIGKTGPETGLRDTTINGNIVNENSTTSATLRYTLDGSRNIIGNLGSENGTLDLVYQPLSTDSNFTVNGNTVLNVVDVKSGNITYSTNSKKSSK
ncbi:exo-alpha-sialidase [Ursidibacter sp. B-7004-1]